VLIAARADDPSLPLAVDELIRSEREARPTKARDDDVEVIGGRYRLGELLGSGGAGRVFKARDEVSGRDVAIKLLSTGYAHGHEAFERFVREARVASALRHPNLVEVFDFSADHGYIVMELMAGGSLAGRIDSGLTGRAVQRICLDVLGGLDLAHQRGIIHRDVKPANVFFDARGTAKLGDFGVAHLLDLGQTQTGGLIGTLAYMSPEQITGAPLTIAADLYAIGITLFEALTGRLPFLGPDFVAQHLGDRAPLPSEVAEDVDKGWDVILSRLLCKSPGDRFDTVDDLRRAVSALSLGERGQRPLMIPRAKSYTPRDSSQSIPVQRDADEKREDAPRYDFETSFGNSEGATLSRALDTALDRSVIIERYDEPIEDSATERRLYSLARGGGPFLQRALSYDRAAGVAVFEAPAGSPLSERDDLSPRHIARLLKRLARAVAPLHEKERAHGHINETTVLLDGNRQPTVLTCGLGPITTEPTPKDDVAAIIGLIANLTEAPQTREGLIDALAPGLSHPERAAILVQDEPRTGEELYAFADAVEIALLKVQRRNRTSSAS
jgi:serine/threonine-protein kinase